MMAVSEWKREPRYIVKCVWGKNTPAVRPSASKLTFPPLVLRHPFPLFGGPKSMYEAFIESCDKQNNVHFQAT
jgi:hypothetical protein